MQELKEKSCFVISPIGSEGSPTRERSNDVLDYIIKPAVEILGFKAIRADQISEPGIITRQIIDRILNDEIVIADLSEHNPNVFYELAIRHSYRKPVVQLIQSDEIIPFDVAHNRTIIYDHRSMRSVDQAKAEITRQVEAALSGKSEIDNPVSYANEIRDLKKSNSPEDARYSAILQSLQDIQTQISHISVSRDNTIQYKFISDVVDDYRELMREAFFRHSRLVETLDKISVDVEKLDDETVNRINAVKISAHNVQNLFGILMSDDTIERLKRGKPSNKF